MLKILIHFLIYFIQFIFFKFSFAQNTIYPYSFPFPGYNVFSIEVEIPKKSIVADKTAFNNKSMPDFIGFKATNDQFLASLGITKPKPIPEGQNWNLKTIKTAATLNTQSWYANLLVQSFINVLQCCGEHRVYASDTYLVNGKQYLWSFQESGYSAWDKKYRTWVMNTVGQIGYDKQQKGESFVFNRQNLCWEVSNVQYSELVNSIYSAEKLPNGSYPALTAYYLLLEPCEDPFNPSNYDKLERQRFMYRSVRDSKGEAQGYGFLKTPLDNVNSGFNRYVWRISTSMRNTYWFSTYGIIFATKEPVRVINEDDKRYQSVNMRIWPLNKDWFATQYPPYRIPRK